MKIDDIFRCERRKPIPVDRHWVLVDQFAESSLKTIGHPSEDEIRQRIAELREGENKLGFVYEGELIWLEMLLNGQFDGGYAQWVLAALNDSICKRPLRWAAFNDAVDHTSTAYIDVWAAVCETPEVLPIDLVPKAEFDTFFSSCSAFRLAVYGKEQSPSEQHLIVLFERLHNLPYYISMSRQALVDPWVDTHNHLTGVSVIDVCDPEKWQVDEDNQHSAIGTFSLYGRDPHPPWTDEDPPNPLLEEVRSEIRAATGTSKTVFDEYEQFYFGDCNRHLYENLHLLSHNLRERVLPSAFQMVETSDGPVIQGQATLRDVNVECCSHSMTIDLDFTWGTKRNYRDYRVGDAIHWGVPEKGYRELKHVFVEGSRSANCPDCGARSVLIRIKNNQIAGVDMAATNAVNFIGEAPYVQDAALARMAKGFGVDDLVTWRDFEPRWLYKMAEQNTTNENCPDRELILKGLRQVFEYTENRMTERGLAWLHCKYRHLWSREQFVRSMAYLGPKFYGADRLNPTNHTPVKSMAVVHLEYDGQPVVVGIWWGDLLNFPEYRVGDSIRWSDYSLGDPEADEVYACWWPMLGFSLLDKVKHNFVKIQNNLIVGFDDGPEVEETINFYNNGASAYVGTQPYLIWPDEEVL